MVEIAVAVIAGMFGLLTVYVANKVRVVETNTRTNHGKRAGEYLEQIGQIAEGQQALFDLFAEHARHDDEQFAELRELVVGQIGLSHERTHEETVWPGDLPAPSSSSRRI